MEKAQLIYNLVSALIFLGLFLVWKTSDWLNAAIKFVLAIVLLFAIFLLFKSF